MEVNALWCGQWRGEVADQGYRSTDCSLIAGPHGFRGPGQDIMGRHDLCPFQTNTQMPR